jgi:hypothetical protein
MRKQNVPLKGPVDHDVPVLAVRNSDGSLRAVLFGYACHCTTLDSYRWSGDYAGFAQLALEEKYPGAAAMFHAGCGADQNPLPRRSEELCREYGQRLARSVAAVLDGPMRPIAPRLATRFERIRLEYGQPLSKDSLEKIAQREDYEGRRAQRLLEKLQQGRPLETSYRYPVQAWKLGEDQLWISLGGEVVVDYALDLKAEYGRTTWVTAYSNDVMAYIPSKRVWTEGGYEAGAFAVYGLPTDRWAEDVPEKLLASVDRLVRELAPKPSQ